MKRIFLKPPLIMACILLAIAQMTAPVHADDYVDRIRKPIEQAITIRQQTQAERERWQAEQTRLRERLASLQVENQQMLDEQRSLQAQLEVRRGKNKSLARQIKNSALLSREMGPYLESVYRILNGIVKTDLPFLRQERQNRLNRLRGMLDDPDIPTSEKYRRIMEALLIEAEYGSTVEVYRARIPVSGRELTVDILRLGRVSLFFQNPDRSVVGTFDPRENSWRELGEAYKRDINTAIDIAAKRRPARLINLPLGGITAP